MKIEIDTEKIPLSNRESEAIRLRAIADSLHRVEDKTVVATGVDADGSQWARYADGTWATTYRPPSIATSNTTHDSEAEPQ